jgi:AcrR family transcriptional regulator
MSDVDRRVMRTQRLLAEALVALVSERRYEDITIRDITDRADIGYATFFRHYDGKDDLMLDIFTRILNDLEARPDRQTDRFFEQEGAYFFQHVADHAALYRSILDSQPFARKLREHVVARIRAHLDSHAADLPAPAIPLEIAAQHMVSSLLGLVDWWLVNAQPYPVPYMATLYERLIIQATWYALIPSNRMVLPWDNAPKA